MNIAGKKYRSIWVDEQDQKIIHVIDQQFLPHELVIKDLKDLDDFAFAIKDMAVRGAPLIGVTAAYGFYSCLLNQPEIGVDQIYNKLLNTRPTASNLQWALDHQMSAIAEGNTRQEKTQLAFDNANKIAEQDIAICKQIGENGLEIIRKVYDKKQDTVNILTHCNAGWLATVDYGTATAPIYMAHDMGIPIHVWVDETRPRNQGASITAYELGEHGIPHTVIVDNAGGHLMQHKKVDLCIVGTDRTTLNGDVCNKIGTYEKALAAKDNNIPFYVALPSSTIDWDTEDALTIPIEERDPDEVKYITGFSNGKRKTILLTPEKSPAANYAFDVTPARLVTALITDKGICKAERDSISKLFPKKEKIS